MSCDDNHEARDKDRARRKSLPIIGSASASTGTPRKLWRSIEERSTLETPGAANEFPGGASELSGVSRRNSEMPSRSRVKAMAPPLCSMRRAAAVSRLARSVMGRSAASPASLRFGVSTVAPVNRR